MKKFLCVVLSVVMVTSIGLTMGCTATAETTTQSEITDADAEQDQAIKEIADAVENTFSEETLETGLRAVYTFSTEEDGTSTGFLDISKEALEFEFRPDEELLRAEIAAAGEDVTLLTKDDLCISIYLEKDKDLHMNVFGSDIVIPRGEMESSTETITETTTESTTESLSDTVYDSLSEIASTVTVTAPKEGTKEYVVILKDNYKESLETYQTELAPGVELLETDEIASEYTQEARLADILTITVENGVITGIKMVTDNGGTELVATVYAGDRYMAFQAPTVITE